MQPSRHPLRTRHPRAGRALSTLAVAATVVAGAVGLAPSAFAAVISVTTTGDEAGSGAGCSLREAVRAANTDAPFGGCAAGSGADTITVPAGTYTLTVDPGPDENAGLAGDLDVLSSVTLDGAGAGSTVIGAGNLDRVLDILPLGGGPVTVGLSGLTLTDGRASSSNFNVGGAAFIGPGATVSITNSTISDSQAVNSTGGGVENRGTLSLSGVTMSNNSAHGPGGAVHTIGALTVLDSTFTGNSAESGGALYVNSNSDKSTTISRSGFSGNTAVATAGGVDDNGGAIAANTDGAVSVTGSRFTSNTAAGAGGAVWFGDSASQAAVGSLTLSYSRLAGSTSAAGTGTGLHRVSGTVVAERNWWGCGSGPSAAPCDTAVGGGDVDPWIVLTHQADPVSIGSGQSAGLTAGFLTNSDGSVNAAADLGALVATPISFGNAVLGTISSAQTTVQAGGTATATYTAGSTAGAGSASATVDFATVTAAITVTQSDTTPPDTTIVGNPTNPSGSATATFTFSGTDTGTGVAGFECRIDGGGFSACTSPQTYNGLAEGSHTFAVRAVDNAGLVDPTPASYTWTVDTSAPSVTIDQASDQADPTTTSPVHFTAVFSERVSGFTASDVSLSGTAVATVVVVTQVEPNDGTTYDVAVGGLTGAGTVVASVPAGAARDAAGTANTASTSTDATVTYVRDGTAPVITPTVVGTLGSNGWYTSDVSVTWSVVDPDSAIDSQTGCGPQTVTVDTAGVTFTCAATSAGGSDSQSVTIGRDATAPTLAPTVSPDPVQLNQPATATPNASDALSGVASQGCSQPDTTTAGAKSVTCTATDDAGNTAGTTKSYTVLDGAPTIAAVGGACLSETAASGSVTLGVGDPNTPAWTLTLRVVSTSNASLVPVGSVTFAGTGDSRTMTVRAAARKSGRATLVIGVSDGTTTTTLPVTVVVGTSGSEVLTGTTGTDLLFGLAGANTIHALAGADVLCGGNGSDVLNGSDGDDTLSGGRGGDTLSGGAGDDRLTGGSGGDRFGGGADTDTATDFTRSQGDTTDGTVEIGVP